MGDGWVDKTDQDVLRFGFFGFWVDDEDFDHRTILLVFGLLLDLDLTQLLHQQPLEVHMASHGPLNDVVHSFAQLFYASEPVLDFLLLKLGKGH